MSTFLQLCQRVRQECGVAGAGPTTVTGQTGMYGKIVDWTARAWVDIQASRPYWKFLRATYTGTLTIAQQDYLIVTDLGLSALDKIDPDGTFIYETSVADQTSLTWKPYQEFRALYKTGFGDGRPTMITEIPGDKFRFNRLPLAAYTVSIDYWMTPELLAANGDAPACPEHFHDIIVWKAVQLFCGNEGASELRSHASSMYGPMFVQLMLDQMETPMARRSFPLATGRKSYSDTSGWGSN